MIDVYLVGNVVGVICIVCFEDIIVVKDGSLFIVFIFGYFSSFDGSLD